METFKFITIQAIVLFSMIFSIHGMDEGLCGIDSELFYDMVNNQFSSDSDDSEERSRLWELLSDAFGKERKKIGIKPFTANEVRALITWDGPKGVSEKMSWTVDELLQNPQTKRLYFSEQEVKDLALKRISSLREPGHRYIAACCIAAGANPEKHATRTSWLSEAISRDDVGFIQAIVHAKPNPNRRHQVAHSKERIVEEPLFFNARNIQMAQALLSLGADYQEKDGLEKGTILHHLCTWNVNKPEIELLKFYLEHGANPRVVDDKGCTALHRVGKFKSTLHVGYSMPYALMLLRYGASLHAKDNEGKTFLDYVDMRKFRPEPGHLSNRIFYVFMQEYGKGNAIKRQARSKDILKEPIVCGCVEPSEVEAEKTELPIVLQGYVQSWSPILPESCKVLDCNELRKHPKYPFWQRVIAIKDSSKEFGEGAEKLIDAEIAPAYLDWHKGRMLVSMAIAVNPSCFTTGLKDFELGNLALLEDDYEFVAYMLKHRVHRIGYIYLARSVAIAALLKQYQYPCAPLDTSGGNQLHYVAQWGVLVDDDLPQYYLDNGVDLVLENKGGQTPLQQLAQYSYHYIRHEKKLIEIARMLLLAGADPTKKNEKSKESALEIAQSVHALWHTSATGLLVKLLTVASVLSDTQEKLQVIEKEASLMLNDIAARTRPQGLTRVKGSFFEKIKM